MAALALTDTATLLRSLTMSGALELEAFGANLGILEPATGDARPFAGTQAELADLRAALAGSRLWEPGAARNLQDPLAFRSIVQVHGAARDALGYAFAQLGVELNAHQHNPLVLDDRDEVVSGASFDVLALSAALDFVRIALAPALTSAVERTAKLLQSPHSGLPGGLASRPGPGGGLGEMLWTAHALVVEARLLAQPVSYELATTTGEEGIADRITSAPLSARRLGEQVALGHRILADRTGLLRPGGRPARRGRARRGDRSPARGRARPAAVRRPRDCVPGRRGAAGRARARRPARQQGRRRRFGLSVSGPLHSRGCRGAWRSG